MNIHLSIATNNKNNKNSIFKKSFLTKKLTFGILFFYLWTLALFYVRKFRVNLLWKLIKVTILSNISNIKKKFTFGKKNLL